MKLGRTQTSTAPTSPIILKALLKRELKRLVKGSRTAAFDSASRAVFGWRTRLARGIFMKFYDSGRAPNPRRTRIFLAEKGISLPTEQVDIMKMEHKKPEYAAINPLQRMPSLVLDDGTVITESIAICRYFEALRPDPPLFGEGAKEVAQVEMWNRRCEINFMSNVAAVFRHLHPSMKELEVPQVPEWAEANKPRVTWFLELLNRELGQREFIAGDRYSVADITALVSVDFMRPAKLDMPEGLGNVKRWHAAVSARPSATA
jgi:glutathione S-transferase